MNNMQEQMAKNPYERLKKNPHELIMHYEIKSLDEVKLIDGTNRVLIEIFPEDTNQTIGGIYTEGLKPFNFAEHAERRGIVIKACERVVPAVNHMDTMRWECDVDIQEGDEVWLNYFDQLNAFSFRMDKRIFKLVHYSSLIIAKRGDETIMLNGYVLITPVKEKIGFGEYEKEVEVDKQYEVVELGKLNKRYIVVFPDRPMMVAYHRNHPNSKRYGHMFALERDDRTDSGTEDLKVGDKILVKDNREIFPLEEYAYARFKNRELFKICQRHNIIAIFG
jgi:hypothetical protein